MAVARSSTPEEGKIGNNLIDGAGKVFADVAVEFVPDLKQCSAAIAFHDN